MADEKPPQPPPVFTAAVLMKPFKTIEACGLGDMFRRELGGEAQLATAANPEEAGVSARAGSRGHGNTSVVPDGVADIEAIDAAGTAVKDEDEDDAKNEPTGSHSATHSLPERRRPKPNQRSPMRTLPPRPHRSLARAKQVIPLRGARRAPKVSLPLPPCPGYALFQHDQRKGSLKQNKARCPMWTCEAFQAGDLWTSEEFVDHLLEKHPSYLELEE
jgi:hypothetical protein